MLLIKWQNLVIEQIGGCYRSFGGIQLGKTYFGIVINKGLQVNSKFAKYYCCNSIEPIFGVIIIKRRR
jgi:hypothetical protein